MSKTAIVTGASRGMGHLIAEELQKAGYQVFGTSRKGKGYEKLDVTDPASCQALVKKVLERTGRIDLLVNNAGVAMHGTQEEASDTEILAQFEVNYFGAVRMARAVLPAMRAARSGLIVHISSMAGILPSPYMGHYGAAKHALEGFSKALDEELRPMGVRSVLLRPAFIRTDIGDHAMRPGQKIADYDPNRMRFLSNLEKALGSAEPPSVVARDLMRLVTRRKPLKAYPAGKQGWLLQRLFFLLPERMFLGLLRRLLNLSARP